MRRVGRRQRRLFNGMLPGRSRARRPSGRIAPERRDHLPSLFPDRESSRQIRSMVGRCRPTSPLERTADPTLTTNRFTFRTAPVLGCCADISDCFMRWLTVWSCRSTVDRFAVPGSGFRVPGSAPQDLLAGTWHLELGTTFNFALRTPHSAPRTSLGPLPKQSCSRNMGPC
jgi:hypothetical protein